MRRQPIEIQTLYAELLDRLIALEAQRALGNVPGSFVTKTIKGGEYYYFQQVDPGGKKRQSYVGRRSEHLDALAQRHANERSLAAPDVAGIERLSALLRAGGVLRPDSASARVIRALADSGVFRLGGVLVGTHAFVTLGNVLGVEWSGTGLRTQDIDIAADQRISVAVSGRGANLPGVLDQLDMGFLPVPAFDPAGNTTSFKVRGHGLRVDLLAPAVRVGQRDVRIPRFNAWAQPLKFLDYVMEDTADAAAVDGGAVLVSVPSPARFALHKLIVANERPPTMHAKREKDLWQAARVLEVVLEERRGDLPIAWAALSAHGTGWVRRALAGLGDLESSAPGVADRLKAAIGVDRRVR
jgi:hypothetical protein